MQALNVVENECKNDELPKGDYEKLYKKYIATLDTILQNIELFAGNSFKLLQPISFIIQGIENSKCFQNGEKVVPKEIADDRTKKSGIYQLLMAQMNQYYNEGLSNGNKDVYNNYLRDAITGIGEMYKRFLDNPNRPSNKFENQYKLEEYTYDELFDIYFQEKVTLETLDHWRQIKENIERYLQQYNLKYQKIQRLVRDFVNYVKKK